MENILIRQLEPEQLPEISQLIRQQLAEPYSIYTYKFFLKYYPKQSLGAFLQSNMIGLLIGRIQVKKNRKRGYLAMIVVRKQQRNKGIGKILMKQWMASIEKQVQQFVLETEAINVAALKFYQKLGFLKTKRMANYYMSGNDAFRLKYIIKNKPKVVLGKQQQGQQNQQKKE